MWFMLAAGMRLKETKIVEMKMLSQAPSSSSLPGGRRSVFSFVSLNEVFRVQKRSSVHTNSFCGICHVLASCNSTSFGLFLPFSPLTL